MTADKIRKRFKIVISLNQLAAGLCGACCALGGMVGAVGLAAAGPQGPVLVILAGSLLNLLMAQRALANVKGFRKAMEALDVVAKEHPEATGEDLARRVMEKLRDKS